MIEPTLIMADRADHVTHEVEAEPVLASVRNGRLLLVLDDGATLELDADTVGAVLRDAA